MFIVAGVRLYRDTLVDALGRVEGMCVVGAHAGDNGVVANLAACRPDVALLDMTVPQSHALARDIQRDVPDISVVAHGVGTSEQELLMCAEAGITGYLTTDATVDELRTVIESAARGELICSPRLMRALVRSLAAQAARPSRTPHLRFTPRERQVLRLIEQQLSNKEIAVRLGVEVATVKNHVHKLLRKLGVRRRHEAVRALKPKAAASLSQQRRVEI